MRLRRFKTTGDGDPLTYTDYNGVVHYEYDTTACRIR